MFCPSCHILQPLQAGLDHFALLGLERRFDVDRERLEASYRVLQQQVHPDRFATRTATERRYSLEHVTRLNEAYRTLLHPLARAEYMVGLLGFEVRGKASDPAFLMEVMELREALEGVDLRAVDAGLRLDRLRREVERRVVGELEVIAGLLAVVSGGGVDLERIARHIDRSRYFTRFLEELERREERVYEEGGG